MKESYRKGAAALAVLATLMWIPNVSLGATKDNDSKYDVRYSKIPVEERKSWKIKFNKELDSSTVNNTNIVIEDEKGNDISADISLDKEDNQKKTIVVKPYSRLKQGEEYHMIIKGDVKSKNGRKIKKPIKVYFNTKNVFAGLPCEDGVIIVGDTAYSVDYLAQNARLRNEIINEEYYIYYCYSPTEQKIKDIFKDEELKSKDVNRRHDTITYINENGDKSIYEWSYDNSEYELVSPGVDVNITANSNAKVVTVKVKKIRGVDDATYFKLSCSNEMKKIGETVVFTSSNLSEKIYILNSNKNIIATGRLLVSFTNSGYKNLKIITDNNKGNTPGNINNNGYASEDNDGYLFYNNTGDRNNLYKLDTNGMFNNAIAYDNAQYINVLDEWVYYSNYSDKGKLYKIKTDGTGKQKLADDMAAYTTVAGEWIYYSNHSDGGKLYKIRPNGKDRRQVNSALNHEVAYINVVGNWIYYTDKTDKHTPYVINLEGSYVSKLSEQWADSIQVVGDWIYYTSSTGVLSKVKKDGSGKIIPIQGQTREFDKGFHLNVVGIWIYYSNYLDGGKLYKIKTDGSGEKLKLTNETVGYINIASDYIYYTSGGKLYKLPIDADGKIKGEQITKASGDNKIIQMDDLKVTVPYYDVDMKLSDIENKYLPKKAPGIKDDNTMHQFSVTWDRDKVTVKNGIRTYTGDIIGYNRKVKLELEIPSQMLNETNTITIYNNADKNADKIIVENLYDNNLISNPAKLNVGDTVNAYEDEDCTKLLSKATVTRDGKYNRATIQRLELDKYGQKGVWLTVLRIGKSESRPTKVKHGDIPTVVKAEDYDNPENYSFYSNGLGIGVDGRDFKISEWVPSQVMGESEYSIYILPSNGKLDISKEDMKPVDILRKGTSTWQGSKDLTKDSKLGILKKGKYSMFLVGKFNGEASEDNRGKCPKVKGYVSSDSRVIDVTEETLPKTPGLRVKNSVKGGADIELSKAPAKDEHVWLIPINLNENLLNKIQNWSSEGNVRWPMDELRQVATCLEGDGSKNTIKAPVGMDPSKPDYRNVEYKLIAVNKIGVSQLSKENVIVDNKAPEMFDEFKNPLNLGNKKPEDTFKVKVTDKGSDKNTINEPVSIYIVPSTSEHYNKEILDMSVNNKQGKVFKVNKDINFTCSLRGLEAMTKQEYLNHYEGKNLTNYKMVAVDMAGNISSVVYFNIIVDTEKLDSLIKKAEDKLWSLDDAQEKTLTSVLNNAKKIQEVATTKTQGEIDRIADQLELTMSKVGITSGTETDPEKIVHEIANGLKLKQNGEYLPDRSSIDSDILLPTQSETSDITDATITWRTSNENIISNQGVVKRPIKDKTVELTATIKYNNKSYDKKYTLTVKGIDLTPKIVNVEYDALLKGMKVEFSKPQDNSDLVKEYRVVISDKDIKSSLQDNMGVSVGTATNTENLTYTVENSVTKAGTYYIYVIAIPKEDKVAKEYNEVVYAYGTKEVTDAQITPPQPPTPDPNTP